MRLVRIGTAAVSVKVGDFAWNTGRLRAAIEAAREQKVHLLVTPELAISGYSRQSMPAGGVGGIRERGWAAYGGGGGRHREGMLTRPRALTRHQHLGG